jgi:hypothetical protein
MMQFGKGMLSLCEFTEGSTYQLLRHNFLRQYHASYKIGFIQACHKIFNYLKE